MCATWKSEKYVDGSLDWECDWGTSVWCVFLRLDLCLFPIFHISGSSFRFDLLSIGDVN